jgi:tRNA-dihydrouridine synthase
MGCPAKKISDRGAGAGLIRTPEKAQQIIQEVKRARADYLAINSEIMKLGTDLDQMRFTDFCELLFSVKKKSSLEKRSLDQPYYSILDLDNSETQKIIHSLKVNWEKLYNLILKKRKYWKVNSLNQISRTVSVKTRIGYEYSTITDWIVKIASQQPDFIALHGRTLKQLYTGSADWNAIKQAKQTLVNSDYKIPLYANGDINSVENAEKCLQITNSDGLLVGRGTYGDPELLFRIKQYVKQEEYTEEFSLMKKIEIMLKHCEYYEMFEGKKSFFVMRKHLAWLTKEFPNAVALRKKLVLTNSMQEVKKIMDDYINGSDFS